MSLIICEKCGNKKSKNAQSCPHCNHSYTPKQKLLSCHECGEMLEVEKFRLTRYYTYIKDGNTAGGSTIDYIPCPKCGEPKALIYFRETWQGLTLICLSIISWIILALNATSFWCGFTKCSMYPGGNEIQNSGLYSIIGFVIGIFITSAIGYFLEHRFRMYH